MVEWEVVATPEWAQWWSSLTAPQQDEVASAVGLLRRRGPTLPFPYSSGIRGSRLGHLRELRVQAKGVPLRTLYAFDPRRVAVLLVGGDKSGGRRWYARSIAQAERLYGEHLARLRQEGLIP